MPETSGKTHRREAHLRDYFIVMDRHKWLIIAALLATLSSTILYLKRRGPIYEARASIIIEPKRPQEMVFPQSVQAISLDLETQIEVIKTTPVLASVARQLDSVTDPERANTGARHLGLAEYEDSDLAEQKTRVVPLQAVERLRRNIKISFVKDTRMVTIAAKHSIPEKAQAIANAVAQAYINQDRLSRLQSGRDSVRWLSAQIANLRTKLKGSEEAFQRFREREGMITLDDRRSEELKEISRLNATYLAARSNRLEIEAIVARIENQGSGIENPNIPIALLGSPILQRLGAESGQLQTELADRRKLFKDTYPGVIELKDRIQLTEQRILAELKRQRDFLEAQEDSFLAQQEAKRKESLKLSRKELEYSELEREATTNREMYNILLAKVKELSLAGKADLNNIRIVEPAELPSAPVGNSKLTLVLGGVLGLFLGISLAFFLEYLENTIRTPDDVEQHLALPVLGFVPRIAGAKRSETPPLIIQDGEKDLAAEAYRSLRTNLLFSELGNSMKTIVITSAGPGEGKSITVANLGMALAQAGKNVLLVDADFRQPILHRVFKVSKSKGISTVLAEELTVDEVIMSNGIPNLNVLTSGMLPPNPSEILGSAQMKGLISHLREQYDIVLFDSAPILGIADTSVLAAESDGTVLVIETGEATCKALEMAVAQLRKVGAEICGVVLNNVDIKRDGYYGYYYSYSPYEYGEEYKQK